MTKGIVPASRPKWILHLIGKVLWQFVAWTFLLPVGIFAWFKNRHPKKKIYYIPKIAGACLLLALWVYMVIYMTTGHSRTFTVHGDRVTIHCVSAQCNDVAKELAGTENLKSIASIGVAQIEDPKSTDNKDIKTVEVYATHYHNELKLALFYDENHMIEKISNADFPSLVYFSKNSSDTITKYPALQAISSLKSKAKAEAEALEVANKAAEKKAKALVATKAKARQAAAAQAKKDQALKAKVQKASAEKAKKDAAARSKAAQAAKNKAKADAAAKAKAQKQAVLKAKANAVAQAKAQAKAARLNGYAGTYCSAHANTRIPLPYYDGSIWKLNTTAPTRYLTTQNCLTVATYLVDQLKLSDGNQYLQDVLNAKIAIGMNYYEALLAWGMPNDVNNTTTSLGTYSQWVYGSPLYGANYVYVDNGIVDSYQTF